VPRFRRPPAEVARRFLGAVRSAGQNCPSRRLR
jgi:hypothetical protein